LNETEFKFGSKLSAVRCHSGCVHVYTAAGNILPQFEVCVLFLPVMGKYFLKVF